MNLSEETKLELRKPIMGLISMILGSLLILSFIVFSFIKTPDKNITPELGEISSAVFLMICFSLGIVGILKKSLTLQKIAIFVFSVFVFIESIFNILDFTDLIVKFYEPIYFLYLLPYFLIIGASAFNIVASLLYIIKKDARICVIASFISRLIVVPLLAFSIFEFFLNLNNFVNNNIFDALFIMLFSLGTIFIELGEHFFFDYMGDVACETKFDVMLTKEASLFLVINVGVIYLAASGFTYVEFSVDLIALFYVSIAFSFLYLFFVIFSFFYPKFMRITLLSATAHYLIQIALTVLLFANYSDSNILVITIFTVIVLILLPVLSVYLYNHTFKVLEKEMEEKSEEPIE